MYRFILTYLEKQEKNHIDLDIVKNGIIQCMQNVPLILTCLILMFQPYFITQVLGKVSAPNYEFKLESLDVFLPGNSLEKIKSQHGNGEIVHNQGKNKTIKFIVKSEKYSFNVFVQINKNVVHDMIARLPSYFLHDVFFQSLRRKLNKQKKYLKTDEEAFYVWNEDNNKHIYSASCTITCFPIFYAVEPSKPKMETFLKKMKKAY